MNQKGFANIVLIILVVVLAGVVGYFAFVKKSEPVTQHPTPTPTQTANQTKTPTPAQKAETTNWKTYKNNLGYTIKYPVDWSYKNLYSDWVCFGKDVKIITQNVEGGRPTRCDGDHVVVAVESGGTTNLEETIAIRREIDPNVEIRRFTVDGRPAITIYGQSGAETFFGSSDNTGYTITLNNGGGTLLRTHYESMISTFRFSK